MKYWKCSECFKTNRTNDEVLISICPACQIFMDEIENEGKEDGRRI